MGNWDMPKIAHILQYFSELVFLCNVSKVEGSESDLIAVISYILNTK